MATYQSIDELCQRAANHDRSAIPELLKELSVFGFSYYGTHLERENPDDTDYLFLHKVGKSEGTMTISLRQEESKQFSGYLEQFKLSLRKVLLYGMVGGVVSYYLVGIASDLSNIDLSVFGAIAAIVGGSIGGFVNMKRHEKNITETYEALDRSFSFDRLDLYFSKHPFDFKIVEHALDPSYQKQVQ